MELEVYKKSDFYEDYISSQKEYYERTNADAYFAERLAEKEREIAMLKERICNGDVSRATWIDDCFAKDKEIAELKQKLEDVNELVKASKELLKESQKMHQRCADNASKQIRRLKRALYNLRACYADMMQKRYIECKTDGWVHRVNKWIEVERKCLKKAEEYK